MGHGSVDIVRAMGEAIRKVKAGTHDPHAAHERIKSFYDWGSVAARTLKVYDFALALPERDLWTRLKRSVSPYFLCRIVCFFDRC